MVASIIQTERLSESFLVTWIRDAMRLGYAESYSRSHDAVFRVYERAARSKRMSKWASSKSREACRGVCDSLRMCVRQMGDDQRHDQGQLHYQPCDIGKNTTKGPIASRNERDLFTPEKETRSVCWKG